MKTILTHFIILIFVFGFMPIQSNADSDNKPKKRKCKCTIKKIDRINDISTLNNTVEFSSWYYVEFERELPVTDLSEIKIIDRVLWMFPEKECELKVSDFQPTEQVVPFWIIIEKETELEVSDLAIK